jgi:hypothetical protein
MFATNARRHRHCHLPTRDVRTDKKVRFSMRDVSGGGMRTLTTCARCLLPGFLMVGLISLGVPCAAQDVDAPTPPGASTGRGGLVAPSAWFVATVPVQERIDIKAYGFYIGELKTPVAQIDVPIKTTRFLTITPSYMYYSVPASGLNELTPKPGRYSDSYDEHQFRIDGTVNFAVAKFDLSARNMYVRRFRPGPLDDMNRYRGRISISRAVAVYGRTLRPFTSYEAFYERTGGWNRDRISSGVTVPVTKHLAVQPSYMWESSTGNRNVNYLLIGLIATAK